MVAYMFSIYPYIGIHVHAIKCDVGMLCSGAFIEGEGFTVPSYAPFGVAGCTFVNGSLDKGTLNTSF